MLQPRAGKKWSNNLSDLLCDLRGPYESGAVEAASFESLSDQARNKTESSFCFFQVTEYVTFVKLEPSWVGLPWCDRRAPRNSYDPGCEPLLSYLHGQTWKNVRICWGDVWLSHHVILGRRAKSNFTCGSPCSNVVLVWYSCSASFTEPCSLPSDVKVCWDVFIGVLIIYTIITLTWRIGFDQALLAQLGTIALNLKQRKWNN